MAVKEGERNSNFGGAALRELEPTCRLVFNIELRLLIPLLHQYVEKSGGEEREREEGGGGNG